MEILLLDVAGLTLERDVTLGTVDEDFTGNNTHGDTSGEYVEKGSLSCTRNTLGNQQGPDLRRKTYHQSSKSTRLDPTIYMVQNPPLLTLNLNVVNHILPAESRGLPLNDSILNLVGTSLLARALGRCTGAGSRVGLLGFGLTAGLGLGVVGGGALERFGNLTTGEDKDFAFGLLSRDVFWLISTESDV